MANRDRRQVQDELNEEVDEAGRRAVRKTSLQDKLKEVIDVKVEDLARLRKKLTISVPRDTIDEQLNEQYDRCVARPPSPASARAGPRVGCWRSDSAAR